MVRKVVSIALSGCVILASGLLAHAPKTEKGTAQAVQEVKELLFAKDMPLRDLEDFFLRNDIELEFELEGLDDLFGFDNEDMPAKSMWQLYRELEYGEDDRPLNLRERMHIVGMMVRDFFSTVTVLVQYEVRVFREQISTQLNGVWSYFAEQVHGDADKELSKKEKAQVVAAITKSYATALGSGVMHKTMQAREVLHRAGASAAQSAKIRGAQIFDTARCAGAGVAEQISIQSAEAANALRSAGTATAQHARMRGIAAVDVIRRGSDIAREKITEQSRAVSDALLRGKDAAATRLGITAGDE